MIAKTGTGGLTKGQVLRPGFGPVLSLILLYAPLTAGRLLRERYEMFQFLRSNRVSRLFVLVVSLSFAVYAGWRLRNINVHNEIRVSVVEAELNRDGSWSLPRDAVTVRDWPKGYLIRCTNLKSERLEVQIAGQDRDQFLVRSSEIKPADLMVTAPRNLPPGEFLNPVSGISEDRLIASVIHAGIAYATGHNPLQAVRFISQDYSDRWGFDGKLLRALLSRAYKEFQTPQVFLDGNPSIHVKGKSALVQAKIRVTATYRGRRNFVLGNQQRPDQIYIWFQKSEEGWKITRIEGLKPLGFDAPFVRLLGAEVGLQLGKTEKQNRKQACMPCRARMAERFGPGN